MQHWVWDGDELLADDGSVIAHVSDSVLHVDGQRVPLERGRTRFELTSTDGSMRLRQQGLTVTTLHADCEGRSYVLARRNPWRKRRDISTAAGVVAEIRPQLSGKVEVRRDVALPLLDAVFLTWVCVLVDAPQRETRI